ncbi:hypothetical protein [Pedobacter sp.]
METDNLKSIWKDISTPQKNKEELSLLLKKNSHPILASIKKQIIIESLGFTAFLFCYFTMFDGASKPLAINLTIVAAIVLQLFYGYKGFLMQSRYKSRTNLNDDLESFVNQLKSHRLQVVLARALLAVGLITFFTYNISFSELKWWLLASISVIFSVQLWLLHRLWSNRINKLEATLAEFKSPNT